MSEVIAHGVEQRHARLDGQVDGLAVDIERDRRRARPHQFAGGCGAARLVFQQARSQRAPADSHAANESAAREAAPGRRGDFAFLGTQQTPPLSAIESGQAFPSEEFVSTIAEKPAEGGEFAYGNAHDAKGESPACLCGRGPTTPALLGREPGPHEGQGFFPGGDGAL